VAGDRLEFATLSIEEKRALLAQRMREQERALSAEALSFAQLRVWFIDQLQPGSPAYHMPLALRLKGELDAQALGRSLNDIVDRHEVLRSSFPVREGRPALVVAPKATLSLDNVAVNGSSGDEREEEATRLVIEAVHEPFDLGRGPLIRARLLRLHEREHVLVVVVHHIVCDGWSFGVMMRELSALYRAHVRGVRPSLPSLRMQYADFVRAQRASLKGKVLDEELGYWRRSLAGVPLLQLPTDRSRPPVQGFSGGLEAIELSEPLTDALKTFSRRCRVSMLVTMLAAFDALLARYSGQDDIVVGIPVTNRNEADLEGLVGFFINSVAVRTDLSGEPSFQEVVGRVRGVVLDAFEHRNVPFERLVQALELERSLSHNPVYQVMYSHSVPSPGVVDMAGLDAEKIVFNTRTAKFDLVLSTVEWPAIQCGSV